VVVADGERIYLGAFWTSVSSISPPVPSVTVESMTAQGMTIDPPVPPVPGPDPREDPRILRTLSETGKLAP